MKGAELVAKIAEDVEIGKATADRVVKSLTGSICKALKKEGKIAIFGFGTFTKIKRKARKGRNPRTGEAIKIKAHSTVKFKSSKRLKDAL